MANHVFHLLDDGGVGLALYFIGGDVEVFFNGGGSASVEGEGVGGSGGALDGGLLEDLGVAFGKVVHLTFPP